MDWEFSQILQVSGILLKLGRDPIKANGHHFFLLSIRNEPVRAELNQRFKDHSTPTNKIHKRKLLFTRLFGLRREASQQTTTDDDFKDSIDFHIWDGN